MSHQIFFPVHLGFVPSRDILIPQCLLPVPVLYRILHRRLSYVYSRLTSADRAWIFWLWGPDAPKVSCLLSTSLLKQSCSVSNMQHQPQLAALYHESSTKEVRCQWNPCPMQAVDPCGTYLPHTSCVGSCSSRCALVSYHNVYCDYSWWM